MEIGKLIKYHRTRQGMTQKELAHGICSVSYLSKVENNSIVPSEDIIDALEERLNISISSNLEQNEKITEQIWEWYEHIKKKDRRAATTMYVNIKYICETSTNIQIKHLYNVMLFFYKLTFFYHRECKKLYENLKETKQFFDQKTLYFFLKFESIYYYYLNDLNAAIQSLKEAEKIYEKLDFVDNILFYNLSIYYRKTYQMYQSFLYIFKTITEAQSALDFEMITRAQIVLASNLIRVGEYKEAKKTLKKLKKSEYIQSNHFKSLIYHNLGIVYYKEKEYKEAIHYLLTSLEYQHDEYEKADTYYVLSLIYHGLNDSINLLKYLQEGKTNAIKYNNKKYIYKFTILEAKINNNYEDCFIKLLRKEIIPFFKKTGERNELMRQLKLLGELYYQNHQYKKAAECYSEIHHLYINTFRLEDFSD